MISKKDFVATMNQLEELDKKMSKVDDAMREMSPDFCNFYIIDVFNIVIGLLEKVFKDTENNWLSYFVWERDWLRSFKLGDITINDVPVEINGWGNVYDFLISNMEKDNV